MKFHGVSFFCGNNFGPGPEVSLYPEKDDKKSPWPISISINETGIFHDDPSITIHFNESQFINFVNSAKWAYDKYRRDKGYNK